MHVRKLGLDQLVVGDGDGKLMPGVCVREYEIEGGLHDSEKEENSGSAGTG